MLRLLLIVSLNAFSVFALCQRHWYSIPEEDHRFPRESIVQNRVRSVMVIDEFPKKKRQTKGFLLVYRTIQFYLEFDTMGNVITDISVEGYKRRKRASDFDVHEVQAWQHWYDSSNRLIESKRFWEGGSAPSIDIIRRDYDSLGRQVRIVHLDSTWYPEGYSYRGVPHLSHGEKTQLDFTYNEHGNVAKVVGKMDKNALRRFYNRQHEYMIFCNEPIDLAIYLMFFGEYEPFNPETTTFYYPHYSQKPPRREVYDDQGRLIEFDQKDYQWSPYYETVFLTYDSLGRVSTSLTKSSFRDIVTRSSQNFYLPNGLRSHIKMEFSNHKYTRFYLYDYYPE